MKFMCEGKERGFVSLDMMGSVTKAEREKLYKRAGVPLSTEATMIQLKKLDAETKKKFITNEVHELPDDFWSHFRLAPIEDSFLYFMEATMESTPDFVSPKEKKKKASSLRVADVKPLFASIVSTESLKRFFDEHSEWTEEALFTAMKNPKNWYSYPIMSELMYREGNEGLYEWRFIFSPIPKGKSFFDVVLMIDVETMEIIRYGIDYYTKHEYGRSLSPNIPFYDVFKKIEKEAS